MKIWTVLLFSFGSLLSTAQSAFYTTCGKTAGLGIGMANIGGHQSPIAILTSSSKLGDNLHSEFQVGYGRLLDQGNFNRPLNRGFMQYSLLYTPLSGRHLSMHIGLGPAVLIYQNALPIDTLTSEVQLIPTISDIRPYLSATVEMSYRFLLRWSAILRYQGYVNEQKKGAYTSDIGIAYAF